MVSTERCTNPETMFKSIGIELVRVPLILNVNETIKWMFFWSGTVKILKELLGWSILGGTYRILSHRIIKKICSALYTGKRGQVSAKEYTTIIHVHAKLMLPELHVIKSKLQAKMNFKSCLVHRKPLCKIQQEFPSTCGKHTIAQIDKYIIDTTTHVKPKVHEGALSTKTCMWNRAALR